MGHISAWSGFPSDDLRHAEQAGLVEAVTEVRCGLNAGVVSDDGIKPGHLIACVGGNDGWIHGYDIFEKFVVSADPLIVSAGDEPWAAVADEREECAGPGRWSGWRDRA